jgi:hypothetical protein
MGALSVVKSQRVNERVEDLIRGAGGVPALQAFVVLDAHTSKRGNLFAAQAGHTPLTVARQANLIGRDLAAPRGQKLRERALPGPLVGLYARANRVRVPCQYPSHRASQIPANGARVTAGPMTSTQRRHDDEH